MVSFFETEYCYNQPQTEIFSKMKNDDKTYTAQKDSLISSFRMRLLKNYQEKHHKNYVGITKDETFIKLFNHFEVNRTKTCKLATIS